MVLTDPVFSYEEPEFIKPIPGITRWKNTKNYENQCWIIKACDKTNSNWTDKVKKHLKINKSSKLAGSC